MIQTAKIEVNEVAELPLHGLNSKMKDLVCEYARFYQCSSSQILGAMLVIAGIAVGKRIRTFDGRYYNNFALWMAIVGNSGSNKSAPLKELLEPLLIHDRMHYDAYKRELAEWRSVADNKAPMPVRIQSLIGDTTEEAMYQVLDKIAPSDNGLLCYNDELATFFENLSRYNNTGWMSRMLTTEDGGDLTINRKTSDDLYITNPMVSIIGTIQPKIVCDYVRSNKMRNSGFNQRWNYILVSDGLALYQKGTLDAGYRTLWNDTIERLFMAKQQVLLINGTSLDAYIDFYNETQLKKSNSDEYMAAALSKHQKVVQKIAGIIHVLNGNEDTVVSKDEMLYAIDIMKYFEHTASVVYGWICDGPVVYSKSDSIRILAAAYPNLNKVKLAESIGVSKQFVCNLTKTHN